MTILACSDVVCSLEVTLQLHNTTCPLRIGETCPFAFIVEENISCCTNVWIGIDSRQITTTSKACSVFGSDNKDNSKPGDASAARYAANFLQICRSIPILEDGYGYALMVIACQNGVEKTWKDILNKGSQYDPADNASRCRFWTVLGPYLGDFDVHGAETGKLIFEKTVDAIMEATVLGTLYELMSVLGRIM